MGMRLGHVPGDVPQGQQHRVDALEAERAELVARLGVALPGSPLPMGRSSAEWASDYGASDSPASANGSKEPCWQAPYTVAPGVAPVLDGSGGERG